MFTFIKLRFVGLQPSFPLETYLFSERGRGFKCKIIFKSQELSDLAIKLGKIGSKSDKSGTFSDHISVHFESPSQTLIYIWSENIYHWTKMYWNMIWKVQDLFIWGQSALISGQSAIPIINSGVSDRLHNWSSRKLPF